MKSNFVCFLTSCLLVVGSAKASSVKDVFDSFSQGGAGVYKTPQATHVYGGNITTRIHQPNTPDFVGFSAPKLKSGCGGVDFYAGGFSLISGDEVVQMARGIAQGAAPYFFNLAISSICASCGQAMENLSDRLNEINQFAKASCQSFYKSLDDATGWQDSVKKNSLVEPYMFDEELGLGRSWVDSIMDPLKNTALSSKAQDIMQVNTTYYMLNQVLGPDDYSSNLFFNSTKDLKLVLMSMMGTGTTLFSPNEEKPKEQTFGGQSFPSLIEPLRMIQNDPNNIDGKYEYKGLTCGGNSCLPVSRTTEAMVPLETAYFELLYDSPTEGPGIFKRLKTKTALTAKQVAFMQSAEFPYVNLAIKFKTDGAIKDISTYIAQRAAYARVESLYEIGVTVLYRAKSLKWGGDEEKAKAEIASKGIDAMIVTMENHLKNIRDQDAASRNKLVNELSIFKATSDAIVVGVMK